MTRTPDNGNARASAGTMRLMLAIKKVPQVVNQNGEAEGTPTKDAREDHRGQALLRWWPPAPANCNKASAA